MAKKSVRKNINDIVLNGFDFLTPQERMLIDLKTPQKYLQQFYTPILRQEGLNFDIVNNTRITYQKLLINSSYLVDTDGNPLQKGNPIVLISMLEVDGTSMYDPVPNMDKYDILKDPKFKLRG